MKITIDTKEDSHEEIQKVIRMLSSLVGEPEVMSNQGDLFGDSGTGENQSGGSDMFSDDSSSNDSSGDSGNSSEGSGGGVFNMFGNNSGSAISEDTTEETTEDKKEEKDDNLGIDIPDVEEYR